MEEERVFLKIEMQDGDSALPISFLVLSSGEVWHNDTSLRQKDDKEVCERLIINVSSVANAMAGIAHTKLILNHSELKDVEGPYLELLGQFLYKLHCLANDM